jgi:hypothetical protein
MFCCDAKHMANELVNLGAASADIKIIYFGTDIEAFSPYSKPEYFFEKFGIPRDHMVVLSNRGLAPIYDVETLIKSASDFQQKISYCVSDFSKITYIFFIKIRVKCREFFYRNYFL